MSAPASFRETVGKGDELPATDDVLARVLPLFEQVAEVHERGRVAPLEGVEHVASIDARLFFAGDALEPRTVDLSRFSSDDEAALRVDGRFRKDDGAITDLSVGELDAPIERPVYLPRFMAWEHALDHHDALTDIFVLGTIAAAVALDADLGEPEELRRFVAHRRSLAASNPRLHPVVARAIASMTELDRRERVQDLSTIVALLRTYREQRVDVEPAGDPALPRRATIFRRLRDRLFDFSRRNRLLHFRPTGSTVDLTASSVPLVLDVRSVDADSLFSFRGKAAADLLAQKPIPLSRYLRFEDYPFVGPALDALRLEANRSRAELGFSQLRLVLAFLHWHDLKEDPNERVTSPLLLVPVELEKKRGVRDAFGLTAADDRAEINPVLQQYLRQRYAIELPDFVDLSEAGAIDALHERLTAAIHATEPGVTLERIDKPRIDLVLATARRKLDAYRRKASLGGKHVRSRMGLDYSYRADAIRPLGVQLFHAYVAHRPPPESVMHAPPRPTVMRIASDSVTKELFSLKSAAQDGGPHRWAFDLSSATLANFNYRNVSLVRDYATLVDEDAAPNPAFEALFTDEPKPLEGDPIPLPLAERHEVVLADPTQSAAVARARAGASYVIQGPPGTGKSQTITNLIADHVARGKRVLFVCEKRAALDVVFHRLVQVGIGPLACLIHDARDDKREFLKDLKATYEGWLEAGRTTRARKKREVALERASALVERGGRLSSAMLAAVDGSDASLIALVERAIELRAVDEPVIAGPLPAHRSWVAAAPAIERIETTLAALGHAGPLATHPARLLGLAILDRAKTSDDLAALASEVARDLRAIAPHPLLAEGEARAVLERHRFARAALPLAAAGLGALLDAGSDLSRRARAAFEELARRKKALEAAIAAARGWREPLAEDDATAALALARRFESGFFARVVRWFSPAWWRLRSLLQARFDVRSRAILGDWTEVLESLLAKHRAAALVEEASANLRVEIGGGDPEAMQALAIELARNESAAVRPVRDAIARGTAAVRDAIEAARATNSLAETLPLFAGALDLDLASIERDLTSLARDAHALAPLRGPLSELDRSADVSAAMRKNPIDGRTLEAAVVRRAVAGATRERAADLAIPEGGADGFGRELAKAAESLRDANAEALVETVRARFVDRAELASAPAAGLDRRQKEEKRLYASGRKELEHELGKVMRHKTIREIVSGPAGEVVRDLKPIWLMSPLSVADVLPLRATFDLVVFDEASQIPLEDAVPAIHRAAQCIVVGDRQQLPPTNFFAASLDEADEATLDAIDRELDADSLLTHADRALPSTLLGWHYRSRHESLIDFSNRAFYGGRLLTVPSVEQTTPRPAIVGTDGAIGCERMIERPISFHRVNGVYESRRNAGEARYIAELVRAFLAKDTKLTMGIVAFSEAQEAEITGALDALAEDDPALRARLDEEMAREEDGQHVGLFVKNLENVQGDERDVIVVSVCYGPDPRGRMIMNFGPINRRGGERRLNVIFSRAKHHMAVVSSIGGERITNDYNDGAACLKRYLRYAEASSVGDVAGSEAALVPLREQAIERPRDSIAADIARALRDRGFEVDTHVGSSRLRCELAIRLPGRTRYSLGLLLDGPDAYARGADETFRLKPEVLRTFGWNVSTLSSRDWLADPEAALAAIERACRDDADRVSDR